MLGIFNIWRDVNDFITIGGLNYSQLECLFFIEAVNYRYLFTIKFLVRS